MMRTAEGAFPKRHPFLKSKSRVVRRAEKMHMIGHDQIITDQPYHAENGTDIGAAALTSTPII